MPRKSAKDPLAVEYKRWRNQRHQYLVDVVDVKSYSGQAAMYRTVVVRRVKTKGERAWPVEVFLRTFEPIGRKTKRKTVWQILQE